MFNHGEATILEDGDIVQEHRSGENGNKGTNAGYFTAASMLLMTQIQLGINKLKECRTKLDPYMLFTLCSNLASININKEMVNFTYLMGAAYNFND